MLPRGEYTANLWLLAEHGILSILPTPCTILPSLINYKLGNSKKMKSKTIRKTPRKKNNNNLVHTIYNNITRSHPEMVGDVACDLELWPIKNSFCAFLASSSPILTPKLKHVHLLVLIWERLQTPMTTMPDATVQPLGRHIANKTGAATDHDVSELVERVAEHVFGDGLVQVANKERASRLVMKLINIRLQPELTVAVHLWTPPHHQHHINTRDWGVARVTIAHAVNYYLLRWYGHVLWKEDNDWVKKCMEYEVEGARPRGRPMKTWRETVEKTVKHLDWIGRMPWIVVDGESRLGWLMTTMSVVGKWLPTHSGLDECFNAWLRSSVLSLRLKAEASVMK